MELYIRLKLHVWFAGLGPKLLYSVLKFVLRACGFKTISWVKFFVANMKVSQAKIFPCLQFPNYFIIFIYIIPQGAKYFTEKHHDKAAA